MLTESERNSIRDTKSGSSEFESIVDKCLMRELNDCIHEITKCKYLNKNPIGAICDISRKYASEKLDPLFNKNTFKKILRGHYVAVFTENHQTQYADQISRFLI